MILIRNISLSIVCLLSANLEAKNVCGSEIEAVASNGRSTLKGKIVKIILNERARAPIFRKFFEFTGEVTRVDESPTFNPVCHSDCDDYTFASGYQADLYVVKIKFNGDDHLLAVPRGAIKTIDEVSSGIIPISGDIRYDYLDFSAYLSTFDPDGA